MSQDFQKLIVWRRAHELTVQVYRASQRISNRTFPTVASQLRRAAAAVPTNIVEGCGHESSREFARFLEIAMASATELASHLRLAEDLAALPKMTTRGLRAETTEIKRMLTALSQRVRGESQRPNRKHRQCEDREPIAED